MMLRWPWSKTKREAFRLRKPIEQHIGCDLSTAQSVSHDIKPFERIDLQHTLDRWIAEAGGELTQKLLGYRTGRLGFQGREESAVVSS
jgi:hypothetical protein